MGNRLNSDIYPRNLPDILADFSARYPDIDPVIHMETTQPHLLILLQNGKVSVVFGINDSAPAQSPYVYKELVKSPIVCVCSPRHPLTEKAEISERELRSERLILFDTTKPGFYAAGFQRELIVDKNPNDLFFCESTTTAIILAKAGCGVFCFPEIAVREDKDLTTIPVRDAESQSFGIYYLPTKNNCILKDFISAARKRIR